MHIFKFKTDQQHQLHMRPRAHGPEWTPAQSEVSKRADAKAKKAIIRCALLIATLVALTFII